MKPKTKRLPNLPGVKSVAEDLSISPNHLGLVLRGKRVSPKLLAKVETLNPYLSEFASRLRLQTSHPRQPRQS